MSRITDLKVKIFADGADYDGMVKMSRNPAIKGFTTNPTLMRKAGVSDYEAFARKVLATITDRPVSFEVFADDFASMAEQARTIAGLGIQRERKNPSHQHKRTVVQRVDPRAVLRGRDAQRDRSIHPRSGPRRGQCARPGDTGDCFGFRRAYRRQWCRSDPPYGSGQKAVA